MKNNRKLYYLNIVWLVLWPVAAWFYADHKLKLQAPADRSEQESEIRQGGYKFINPLLDCDMQEDDEIQKYIPFDKKLRSRIKEEIVDKNPNIEMSIYFRNLKNGPWFGIDELEKFSPASLLKVPLMIAWLKEIEKDPTIAGKKFKYEENRGSVVYQTVAPQSRMEPGKDYTVDELIERMIVNSDNEAMGILVNNLRPEIRNKVYGDLGVAVPDVAKKDDYMSVKDYASFFRILYNAAYLNRDNSEKALKILSQSEFKNGLVEGVGSDLVISHKFGERNLGQSDKYIKQLHDCGIIYYPKYPYLLCVMTKGDDYEKLAGTISQIAKTVQEEVSRDYP